MELWVPPMPWPPWNRESTMSRPREMSCWSSDMSMPASIAFQRPLWLLEAIMVTLLPLRTCGVAGGRARPGGQAGRR
jgi:hypothetical protein